MSNKNSKVKKVSNKNKKKGKGKNPFLISFFGALGYWLKSWFSNERCIEAREKKGYIPLLITFASLIIACLPILSSRMSTNVGTVLDSPTYGLHESLAAFQYDATEASVEINIGEYKLQSINNFDNMNSEHMHTSGSGTSAIKYWAHSYKTTKLKDVTTSSSSSSDSSSESTTSEPIVSSDASTSVSPMLAPQFETITVYDLLVFNATGSYASTFATNVLTVGNDPNQWYTSTQTIFATNALIFADDYIYFYKASEGATSATTVSVYYDAAMFQGKNWINLVTELAGQATATTYYTDSYRTSVINAYKTLFVAGFETAKIANAWAYTGIAYVVNLAMVLVFGLMVYLMTRGKNNPYRDYKFLECYKIVGWASFSPALLSMIAFIPAIGSSSIGLLIFVLLLGVRVMWLSMKNLRPSYQ